MTEQQKQWYNEERRAGATALAAFASAFCADMSIRGVEYRYDMKTVAHKTWHGMSGRNVVSIPYALAIVDVAPYVWPLLNSRKTWIAEHGNLVGWQNTFC